MACSQEILFKQSLTGVLPEPNWPREGKLQPIAAFHEVQPFSLYASDEEEGRNPTSRN